MFVHLRHVQCTGVNGKALYVSAVLYLVLQVNIVVKSVSL